MNYYLAEATQNTFLLVESLSKSFVDKNFQQQVHEKLLEKERDDALILLDGKIVEGAFHCKVLLLGVDGLFGEFCANGARSIASYVFAKYPSCSIAYLETKKGSHLLSKKEEGIYSVVLPRASFVINPQFISDTERFLKQYPELHFVDMIEPHLVLQKNLSDDELLEFGRMLNKDKDLFPFGINLNSCYFTQDEELYVKTYERGVQRLTKSCGSGSLSAASYCVGEGEVQVLTAGGKLKICFFSDGVELIGPASFC